MVIFGFSIGSLIARRGSHCIYFFIGMFVVQLLTGVGAASATPAYPGDAVLALAAEDLPQATPEESLRRIQALFDHLRVPDTVRDRYAFMTAARFEKSPEYFEATELSEAILVSTGSVRLSFAMNVVVISGGEVDIAHASGVVVISRGPIRISHGQSLSNRIPGIFVTAAGADIGYVVGASIYAVQGVKLTNSGAVDAYNTDILEDLYGVATKYRRDPIFRGEPVRPPQEESMLVSTGEAMDFSGDRCLAAAPIESLEDRLPPAARKALNCPRIDSTTVYCVRDDSAQRGGSERWTFKGCERTVVIDLNWYPGMLSIGPPVIQ